MTPHVIRPLCFVRILILLFSMGLLMACSPMVITIEVAFPTATPAAAAAEGTYAVSPAQPGANATPASAPASTVEPPVEPTIESTAMPTVVPTLVPTVVPTILPTILPTVIPTLVPTPMPTLVPTPEAQINPATPAATSMEAAARADLAARLGIALDEVTIMEVRAVTWPNGSLGCPQPGSIYTQAMVDGWLMVLEANNQTYFYHSGADGQPFLCANSSGAMFETWPPDDEFVPPPGSEID